MGSISSPAMSHLRAVLKDVHLRYEDQNPRSRKSQEERCNSMPGGNTRTVLFTTPFPLTVASGRSCYLTTLDGHEYVDFLGEYTAGIYGHNHPIIKKAVQEALDGGWNYGAHNVVEGQLATTVCNRFPAIEMVRFVNSGTEANMMALATALAFTGRKKILIFEKGYHGSTISGQVSCSKLSINLPHDLVVGKYNDIKTTVELMASFAFNSLAAILVEPMLGSGGCFAGSHEFLISLRKLADQHGAVLIFDEVMTSRLAYKGYGAELGIKPDMVTLGKWVGGGMSFGAFGGRKDIMDLYDPRNGRLEHPGTFNNNVFSMTAGVAGCALLDMSVLGELNALGSGMKAAIANLLKKHGITGCIPSAPISEEHHLATHSQRPPKMFIKGVGSIMCVHFAGPERDELQGLFFHHMLTQHIYIAQRGFIALSIEIQQGHVDKFVMAVDSFCSQYEAELHW